MPKLTIEGFGTFEIPHGRRLVNAITECGVDIGHRCGGFARCTTCRVEFLEGEPDTTTHAEKEKRLEAQIPQHVRLSCQIVVEHDMRVRPLMRVSEMGWPGAGLEPSEEVTPAAQWVPMHG